MKNRHPVDELGEVRAEIKRLEARERELREAVLRGECDKLGEDYRATIKEHVRNSLDSAAVRAEFGAERLRPFFRESVVYQVVVEERRCPRPVEA